MDEREYWLGFSTIVGMGPAKFKKLLLEFGSAKKAWLSFENSFDRGRLAKLNKNFSIENYLRELKKKNVWFVTLLDKDYPELLRQIRNPPFVLYGKGDISLLKNQNTIGIVGARRTTQYGRDVTKLLTEELVLNGFAVVSGLALGVDAVSHMVALENNGKTIAVLGCGVDCCNPGENLSIYNEILKSGNCIISEFPLGMRPTQWSFPARNRIIAGLSQGVLVTEGAEDSGSLITGEFALKFNRKVFAVPGPITSTMSKGPYKLISKGAKLVTRTEDILKELSNPLKPKIKNQELRVKKGETKEEQMIIDLLQNEGFSFDELVRKTKLKSAQLSSILSMMEIKALVSSSPGGKFNITS